ncbi:MAG: glutathione S-transferase family protein [Proteobacteria bacterium]|nr:glutathione S-transferase family protein [Pseudomonadota bacterium]
MKLYIRPIAPNAVKVMIFLTELGLAIETIDVGTLSDEEYGRINPLKTIPVLKTDDGIFITESLTICQYLDEVTDDARLFGDSLNERMLVAMWERRAEQLLVQPAIEYGHHCQPMFAGALRQFPDWARDHVQQSVKMLAVMENRLAESRFLAADRFTMADLTAFLGIAGLVGWEAIPLQPGPALGRWLGEVSGRPSMAPLKALAQQFGLKSI